MTSVAGARYNVLMTASEMAKRSHEAMKRKYGGTEGYRAYMREIAKRPRKKRSIETYVDTPNTTDRLDSPDVTVGGADRAAVRRRNSKLK